MRVDRSGFLVIPTEHQEQASLFAEAMLRSHLDPRWGLLLAIPNGGMRSKATAGKLKAEGVRAGVPDLFLPIAVGGHHGLWVEMKTRTGGRLSPDQVSWIAHLRLQGYRVEVCPGVDHGIRAIRDYLAGSLARDGAGK
jgi:hypothetical protein